MLYSHKEKFYHPTRQTQTGRRNFARVFLFIITLVFISPVSIKPLTAQTLSKEERTFKAAFIYNFAKFTHWPQDNSDTTISICTIGNDLLVSDLKQLEGKTIKEQQVSITPFKDTLAINCHLIYIAHSEKLNIKKHLTQLKNLPILTVSETENFSNVGGMIELYRENGRTQFIINLSAVEAANLSISSRLLILAKVKKEGIKP